MRSAASAGWTLKQVQGDGRVPPSITPAWRGRRRDGGLSRRQLLIGGGAGVGLLVAWQFWPRAYAPNLRAREGETVYNAWLKIGRDGHVTVAVPQAELGQGAYTALPQILADELGADWRTVAVEPAPLSPLYANTLLADRGGGRQRLAVGPAGRGPLARRGEATRNALMLTGGSSSVRAFEAPLREAGAAARAMLCMAAAARWGASGRRWTRGTASSGAAMTGIPLRRAGRGGAWTIRRRTRCRCARMSTIALPASRCRGSTRRPRSTAAPCSPATCASPTWPMPPVCGPWGSRLAGFDRAGANGMAGVLKIVEDPEWVAVVATNSWSAHKALNAMQPRFHLREPHVDARRISAQLRRAGGGGRRCGWQEGDIGRPLPRREPGHADL